MLPRRALTIAAVLAALATGACTSDDPAPAPTTVDEVGLRIDRLRRDVAQVAEVQREATAGIPPVLDAVRELDAFVAGMRDPERVRTVDDSWPRVDGAVTAADPEGLREGLVEVAVRIDRARVSLARARSVLTEEWERRYLDAEDAVLVAARSYAEASDALVQVLQRHWDTYLQVHARSRAHVQANEFYRSAQEAVQAYEVRIGRLLGPLAAASEEIARFRATQAEAATAVNEAAAAAADAWRDQPAATPTGTESAG